MEAAGAFSVFGCMQMQEMWLVVEYNVPYVRERKGSPDPSEGNALPRPPHGGRGGRGGHAELHPKAAAPSAAPSGQRVAQ